MSELASVAELKRRCKDAGYLSIQINDSEIAAHHDGGESGGKLYEIARDIGISGLGPMSNARLPRTDLIACGVSFPDGRHGGNELVKLALDPKLRGLPFIATKEFTWNELCGMAAREIAADHGHNGVTYEATRLESGGMRIDAYDDGRKIQ